MTATFENTNSSPNPRRTMDSYITDKNQQTDMEEVLTASNALVSENTAKIDPQIKDGNSRIEHNALQAAGSGWQGEITTPTQSYIIGIRNKDLWTLIRRFNKQIFHVKRTDKRMLSNLDMNIAAGENMTAKKLQAHAERLYMTVVINLVSFYKHMVRLRSWREQRTFIFFGVYLIAWLVDLLAPTAFIFLILLISYPRVRDTCFPPAPQSLTDSRTGAVKKPIAGVLASDSVTGAPEENEGEAIEQEAYNFIYSISTLLTNISSGEFSQEEQDSIGPKHMVQDVADVVNGTGDESKEKDNDRTKEPVSRTVHSFHTRLALHMLPDFIDTCERFGNALSPTPPFPIHRPRLILAACLMPPLMISSLVTWHNMMKGIELLIGFGFFGKPVIEYCVTIIDHKYPDWRRHTEMRNTILRGVPTNVQLAITLLRVGEANKASLPPPPQSHGPLNAKANPEGHDLTHLGASREEIQTAINPVSDQEYSKQTFAAQEEGEPTTTRRVANRIKRTTKDGIQAIHKIAVAIESLSSEHLPGQRRALKTPETIAGPVRFPACYKGKKGHLYITTTATTPAISWVDENEDVDLVWTVAIEGMREVRKVSGEGRVGCKRKALVDWALEREETGGLVLRTECEDEFCLTSVSLRDAVFNRIISIGSQTWEVW